MGLTSSFRINEKCCVPLTISYVVKEASGILARKIWSLTQWPLEHLFAPDITIHFDNCIFTRVDHWYVLGQLFDKFLHIELRVRGMVFEVLRPSLYAFGFLLLFKFLKVTFNHLPHPIRPRMESYIIKALEFSDALNFELTFDGGLPLLSYRL